MIKYSSLCIHCPECKCSLRLLPSWLAINASILGPSSDPSAFLL